MGWRLFGNPPIFPLIYMRGAPDIVIVQLNPINVPVVPRDARGILDRANTLLFNASLMRESRDSVDVAATFP